MVLVVIKIWACKFSSWMLKWLVYFGKQLCLLSFIMLKVPGFSCLFFSHRLHLLKTYFDILVISTVVPVYSFYNIDSLMMLLASNFIITVFFNVNFFIVIQLQLCAFSPHPSTPPQPNPLPSPPPPSPLILSMCPL